MNASRWLMAHPQTSAEAAALAQKTMVRGLWVPFLFALAMIALAIVFAVFTDGDAFVAPVVPAFVGVLVYMQGAALVYREAYHRLKAEGK